MTLIFIVCIYFKELFQLLIFDLIENYSLKKGGELCF